MKPLQAALHAARDALTAAAMPTLSLAIGAGFPLYVIANPGHFGAGRMASPITGEPAVAPESLAATLPEPVRRVARAPGALPPGVDPMVTGATPVAELSAPTPPTIGPVPVPPRPRAYRVIGVAEGAALVVHSLGAEIVRPGEVLPDGRTLLRARPDGSLETRP